MELLPNTFTNAFFIFIPIPSSSRLFPSSNNACSLNSKFCLYAIFSFTFSKSSVNSANRFSVSFFAISGSCSCNNNPRFRMCSAKRSALSSSSAYCLKSNQLGGIGSQKISKQFLQQFPLVYGFSASLLSRKFSYVVWFCQINTTWNAESAKTNINPNRAIMPQNRAAPDALNAPVTA